MEVFPKIFHGGIEFKATRGIKQCGECDEYGHITVLNYPGKPECGTYMPYCICEFGRYKKALPDEPQMFEQRKR
jgi:hypothetical protein